MRTAVIAGSDDDTTGSQDAFDTPVAPDEGMATPVAHPRVIATPHAFHTAKTPLHQMERISAGRNAATVAERIGLPEHRTPVSLFSLPNERRFEAPGARRDGKYLVGGELGRGGMGLVTAARDVDLGRVIALKTLLPEHREDPGMKNALLFEARISGQLEHPGIVPIHDVGTMFDGSVYYAMKLVGDLSLRSVLNKLRKGDAITASTFTPMRLLQLFQGVCMALDYAHARGVVHRDVKPANIVIGDYGEVQILDWGVAKIMPKRRGEPSLFGGVPEPDTLVVGTPHYMSPEQARGTTAEVGPQSDIWALGVILFEILTGELPFNDPDEERLLRHIGGLTTAPSPSRATDKRIDPELEAICVRALTPDRSTRYRRAREIKEALEAWAEGTRERERLAAMAEAQILVADSAVERYHRLRQRLLEAEENLRRDERQRGHFDPLPHRREQWAHHLETEHLRLVEARAFAESVAGYNQALAYRPDHGGAREKLQKLYYRRAADAAERGDVASLILYGDLAHTTHTPGHSAEPATLHIRSYPTGATLRLYELGGRDSIDPDGGTPLGTAPRSDIALKPGSYLLSAQLPGCRETREPLVLQPGQQKHVLVTLQPWASGAPLIGGTDELAMIVDAFEAFLADRTLQTLMITGDPGLGKGRLLIEFDNYLDGLPELVTFMFARCNPLHRRVPLRATSDILRHRAGVRHGDSLDEIRRKLDDVVLRAFNHNGTRQLTPAEARRASEVARLCACMPGLCGAAAREEGEGGPDFTFAVFGAIAEYIEATIEMAPLVLTIRGSDNLDRLTRDLLVFLGMRLAKKPVFVMAAAREDALQLGFNRSVPLRPLEAESVQHRLSVLLKGPVSSSLATFVADKTSGNPLHVVEVTRIMLRHDWLRWDGKAWRLRTTTEDGVELTAMSTPELLMLGLADLPTEALDILRSAAICGPVFWREELTERLGRDPTEGLTQLVDAEIIAELPGTRIPGQHEYAFRHDIVQDALYDALDPDERRQQHQVIGAWLDARRQESENGAARLADIARAARHFKRGGDEARMQPLLDTIRQEAAVWERADAPDWFDWPDHLASGVFTPERLMDVARSIDASE